MNKNKLLLNRYFNAINKDKVIEELNKFGIYTHDSKGNKLDSIVVLSDIIDALDKLLSVNDIISFDYIINLIVGELHRNKFICMFIN